MAPAPAVPPIPASQRLPRHVAIIMDGNGRWAQARGLPRVRGHEEGAESVREVVRACREKGIEALTLYSFSTENWNRPADEVEALMALLQRYLIQERAELQDNGIRLRAIGQTWRLPDFVQRPLAELCASSTGNERMVLSLALSYGGRADIVDAARSLARRARDGKLDPDAIDDRALGGAMSTAGLPELDLLVRTSGELRLSNFLLWEVAYAEIVVTDVLWPDFRRPQLDQALAEYASRHRRYGRTEEQIRSADSES